MASTRAGAADEKVAACPLHEAARPFAQTATWRLASTYMAKPGFAAGLASYCGAMSQPPDMTWPANKMFAQKTRYIICYLLVGNYVRWLGGQGAPPTLATLQKLSSASPRHVAEFVKALRLGGFVLAAPSPRDRRSIHLRPAPLLLAEIARSPLAFLEASEHIDPPRAPLAACLRRSHDRLCQLLARSTERFMDGDMLLAPFRPIVHFTEKDCGYPILTAVLGHRYALSGVHGLRLPAPLTYDALAERFQVSRQHIGNIFIEAEKRGWFTVAQGGRLTFVSEDLIHQFETWAAGQMAHYRAIAEEIAL
ncbi:MAG TPA: MarR family transcriptional regulator [Rhizobiaceae bacterium]|nr:MarR family transcriptional regulator [Rhizobiaceae bacterium]